MDDRGRLTDTFEEHRARLPAVAYRMLGSMADADDAVQEAWIRVSRSAAADVGNMGAWLTTVVARACVNSLRLRRGRAEEFFVDHLPEPGLRVARHVRRALRGDRRDGRSLPGRRAPAGQPRVQGAAPTPDPDTARQREVVRAFTAASRDGDVDRLVPVLDPDVVLRAEMGPNRVRRVQGAVEVAGQALFWSQVVRSQTVLRPVLVNGAAGVPALRDGRPYSLFAATVTRGRIAAIDIFADRARLARVDLPLVD